MVGTILINGEFGKKQSREKLIFKGFFIGQNWAKFGLLRPDKT